MKKLLTAIIFGFAIALAVATQQAKYATEKWKIAEGNVRAYSNLLDSSKQKNTALQYTIDQLKYSNDTILRKLNEVRKEMGVKDRNVQSLHYVKTEFYKTDTLILSDTIFKDSSIKIDTTMSDEWYKVDLNLEYPSKVVVTPSFKSEKYIVAYTKKETVNPPKKFFLFRWFQRKHKVLNVDIKEKNPYVQEQTSRYVQIIK